MRPCTTHDVATSSGTLSGTGRILAAGTAEYLRRSAVGTARQWHGVARGAGERTLAKAECGARWWQWWQWRGGSGGRVGAGWERWHRQRWHGLGVRLQDRVAHAVADFEAHLLSLWRRGRDGAAAFLPADKREVARVEAGAVVRVDEVDAGVLVVDEDLAVDDGGHGVVVFHLHHARLGFAGCQQKKNVSGGTEAPGAARERVQARRHGRSERQPLSLGGAASTRASKQAASGTAWQQSSNRASEQASKLASGEQQTRQAEGLCTG